LLTPVQATIGGFMLMTLHTSPAAERADMLRVDDRGKKRSPTCSAHARGSAETLSSHVAVRALTGLNRAAFRAGYRLTVIPRTRTTALAIQMSPSRSEGMITLDMLANSAP